MQIQVSILIVMMYFYFLMTLDLLYKMSHCNIKETKQLENWLSCAIDFLYSPLNSEIKMKSVFRQRIFFLYNGFKKTTIKNNETPAQSAGGVEYTDCNWINHLKARLQSWNPGECRVHNDPL